MSLKQHNIITIALLGLLFFSCKKDPLPTLLNIRVQNDNSTVIENATIKLNFLQQDLVSSSEISQYNLEKNTNASGLASFDFSALYAKEHSGFTTLSYQIYKDLDTIKGTLILNEYITLDTTIILE